MSLIQPKLSEANGELAIRMANYQFSILNYQLVLFRFVGEVSTLHILHVVAYRLGNDSEEVSIAAQEAWAEVLCHAQHIAHYEYLSVDTATSAYTYDGDGQLLSHAACQLSRYLLQYEGEASSLLQQASIAQ